MTAVIRYLCRGTKYLIYFWSYVHLMYSFTLSNNKVTFPHYLVHLSKIIKCLQLSYDHSGLVRITDYFLELFTYFWKHQLTEWLYLQISSWFHNNGIHALDMRHLVYSTKVHRIVPYMIVVVQQHCTQQYMVVLSWHIRKRSLSNVQLCSQCSNGIPVVCGLDYRPP